MKTFTINNIILVLITLILLTTSCSSINGNNKFNMVSFETLQIEGPIPYLNLEKPQIYAIHNEIRWTIFWNFLYTDVGSIKPVPPPVDFKNKVVIAVIDTTRPHYGYSLTIDKIKSTSSGVIVHAAQVSPGKSCFNATAVIQPYHIVTIPIFSGDATLELTQSVHDCGQ